MSETSETPPTANVNTDFKLPIAGFQGTPEEVERQWFEQVYKGRGDRMAQLTWRAVHGEGLQMKSSSDSVAAQDYSLSSDLPRLCLPGQ